MCEVKYRLEKKKVSRNKVNAKTVLPLQGHVPEANRVVTP